MENREAIKIINQYDMNFHWNDGEHIPAEQLAEAFDLAISALEQQEKVNTQSVNLTHTTYPNALESLKILESAKDENGYVPMSLVRLAFRNVLEQDRWIPVTERLPEEYGEYRITWKTSSDPGKRFIGDAEYEPGFEWDDAHDRFFGEWLLEDYVKAYPDVEVTAWKPIGEPYTEDEA